MKKEDISIEKKIKRMRNRSSSKPSESSINTKPKEKESRTEVIKRLEMKKAASRLGVSNKTLFKMLRDYGYFIKCLNDNLPKPELIEKGYFENELRQFKKGSVQSTYIKVYVTANGMSFLSDLINPAIKTGKTYLGASIQ